MSIHGRLRARLGRAPSSAKQALRLLSTTTTSDELSRAISEGLQRGLRNARARAAIARIADTLGQRIAPTSDHEQATAALRDILDDAALLREFGSTRLANMTRLTRAVGLFSASEPSSRAALTSLERETRLRDGEHGYVTLAAIAIQTGDLDRANDVARRARRSRYRDSPATRAVLDYVDLWGGNSPLQAQETADSADARFRKIVSGSGVVLYGPAPALGPLPTAVSPRRVARVLMPGVARWDSADDLVGGRVDVVYANKETAEWLAALTMDYQREILNTCSLLTIRPTETPLPLSPLLRGEARIATTPPGYVYGFPNMIPIMVLDILINAPSSLHITGVTFFVGERAYRGDSLRISQSQTARVDQHGSTGRMFEQCLMLGRHEPLENRRFVANLWSRGLITGDALFTTAVSSSDSDYLEALDDNYGIARV